MNKSNQNMIITAGFIEKPLRAVNKEFAENLSSEMKKSLHLNDKPSTQELNTWLLHYGTYSKEFTEEEMEKFESFFHELFSKYHQKNIVKLLKRDIQSNRELKETSKIVNNFLSIIDASLVQNTNSKIQNLHIDLPSMLQKNVENNIVILWQNGENFRFHFTGSSPFEFTKADLSDKNFNLVNLIDKAIMFNFFTIWADPTVKLIQILNTTLSSLFKILMNNPKMILGNEQENNKFNLYLRIIVAKLSALEQNTTTLIRIFSLHEKLKDELLKVASPELLDKIHLRETFDSQNSISKIGIQLLHTIEEKINYCKVQIRDYIKNAERKKFLSEFQEENKELILLTSKVFTETERLKLWTDKFLDVPYFTFSSSLFTDHLQKIKEIEIDPNIVISASGLFKTYNLGATTVYAIRGMSLDIHRGEFLVIFGTSGAGKTTLLNCIAGLDSPDRGVVYFNGKNLHRMNDKERSKLRLNEMGFIFQNYALLPHYTAKENVTLPSDLAGLSKDLRKRINELLSGVAIDKQSKQFPSQLSGGQMQRVGIARSLTNNPTIIFADEPTGDLDSLTGKQVLDLLRKYHDETGTTVVVITHDKSVADYATRIVTVNDGVITSDTLTS